MKNNGIQPEVIRKGKQIAGAFHRNHETIVTEGGQVIAPRTSNGRKDLAERTAKLAEPRTRESRVRGRTDDLIMQADIQLFRHFGPSLGVDDITLI